MAGQVRTTQACCMGTAEQQKGREGKRYKNRETLHWSKLSRANRPEHLTGLTGKSLSNRETLFGNFPLYSSGQTGSPPSDYHQKKSYTV